jgi:soluble lytic murein transglycosylase
VFALMLLGTSLSAPGSTVALREQFVTAWNAASRGDRSAFAQLPAEMNGYLLYPYLQYEEFRYRRNRIDATQMADFLARHEDWAFTSGLRLAWQKSLGKRARWEDLLQHGGSSRDTVVRCYLARARLATGQIEGLLAEAQSLWAVGQSQPSECDPLFSWMIGINGVTPGLAWERIRLAMEAGNPRLTLYLARFVPPRDRDWLARWQDLERNAYRNINVTLNWPDNERTRQITSISLQRFAKRDAARAWRAFGRLDVHFNWPEAERAAILREIALQSAVELGADTQDVMTALPPGWRDDQILQWWARAALAAEDWTTLKSAIRQMSDESRLDGRWRYWLAVAHQNLGEPLEATSIQDQLSRESSFYGFLAADELARPYTICPVQPVVEADAIARLRQHPGVARALELRAAGLENWALSEWSLASAGLDREGLRTAAALAREENWHDRVIFALGDSGDRQYYDWRFPLQWEQQVNAESSGNRLDPSWVHGVMRSESALAHGAVSSAGALGLMQVTPATARRLARDHGLVYGGREQLKDPELNIRFGTRFMRELLDRYGQNPVLVSGAYNAGPNAVDRWLDSRPRGQAAAWIETIPYYETRDYIPRVLAFTAIYDWRMQRPVTRVSSRMPDVDSGNMNTVETTEVVCQASG